MPFTYFSPCTVLQPYIRSFWMLKGGDEIPDVLYPDGCVDIIVNMGERFTVAQKQVSLEPGTVYLGGALTEAIYETIPRGVYLLGIRFMPGCFGYFYPLFPLGDIRDNCVPLDGRFTPPLQALQRQPVRVLNDYYSRKLHTFSSPVRDIALKILRHGGNITLDKIAAACNKSRRQTERVFKNHTGLTPKQFCTVAKYMHAQTLLASKNPDETLLAIALDAGYYDHAHLTRSFKKISLRTPSGK